MRMKKSWSIYIAVIGMSLCLAGCAGSGTSGQVRIVQQARSMGQARTLGQARSMGLAGTMQGMRSW